MAIGEDKTRTNITIPKDLKAKLEEIAKRENRSFNNLVITVLQKFVEDTAKQAVSFIHCLCPHFLFLKAQSALIYDKDILYGNFPHNHNYRICVDIVQEKQ